MHKQMYHNNITYIDIPQLTVGVLSDTQLSPFGTKADIFDANFVSALNVTKSYNCGVVIVAGDICNLGYANSYRRYNRALKLAYGDKLPIVLNIMGNHDYYRLGSAGKCRKLFTKYTNSPLCGHYCINGYHFVTVSASSGNMHSGYTGHLDWLTAHLDMAVADCGNKPIFVVTHLCGTGTVYGSDGWGDSNLKQLFDKYPTVVNMGGHSHYSILDERSIWQGTHTAINTQSLSYVELERGVVNGTVPPLSYKHPMGMVMQFGDNGIDIMRVSMTSGTEQKADKRWTLPTSIDKEQFTYTDSRQYGTPTISGVGSSSTNGKCTTLHFGAGWDSDFVHSYMVQLTNQSKGTTTTQTYFSDFYLGLDDMAQQVNLKLYNLPRGVYDIRVYAVNSGGVVSDNWVAIGNVKINSRAKYRGITSTFHRFSGI